MIIDPETAAALCALIESTEHQTASSAERIARTSACLLGRPYQTEHPGTDIETPRPLIITHVDCLTYVNTVLALTYAHDLPSLTAAWLTMNYKSHSHYEVATQHHFLSADWHPTHEQAGRLIPRSETIAQALNLPVHFAVTLINRPAFFAHLGITSQHTPALCEQVRTPYLPLSACFDAKQAPLPALWERIQTGDIITVVRPQWDLRNTIGTHLNCSHLGFAIWKDNTLYLRHASSLSGCVCDEPLSDYLASRLNSDTIKGIHLHAATDHPLNTNG
jgi:hypothetical protein